MTDAAAPLALRRLDVVSVLCVVLLAVAAFGTFLHVGSDGLWLDEFFTTWFADPPEDTLRAFLERAAEDVHPPGYYLPVWLTATAAGLETGLAARIVSGAAGLAALAVLYVALPGHMSRRTRLLTCTIAATSALYFSMTQEGRSYTLTWVYVAGLLGLFLRLADARRARPRLLAALWLTGTLAGLTHHYTIPVSGALIAILLTTTRGWGGRAAVAAAGLAILAPNLAFMAWQADRVVIDVADTWFGADGAFLVQHLAKGMAHWHRGAPEDVLGVAIAVAAIWSFTTLPTPEARRGALRGPALVAGAAVLAVGLMIAVTALVVPSLSFRFLVVLVPAYWMLLAYGLDLAARAESPRPDSLAVTTVLILCTALSGKVLLRDYNDNQPWRESAAVIAAEPGCVGAPIPVLFWDVRVISGNEPDLVYGHYLRGGPPDRWRIIRMHRASESLSDPDLGALLTARLAGEDPCPVLAWGVQYLPPAFYEVLRREMLARFGPGRTAELVQVRPPRLDDRVHVLFGLPAPEEGWVLLARPEG